MMTSVLTWTSDQCVANALWKRIERVMALRGLQEEQWSVKAGLSRGYLRSLRSRCSTDDGADIRRDEAVRLARAADVAVEWFVTGEGPISPPARETEYEPDERYANRAQAVYLARQAGISEEAIGRVRALSLESTEDPPVRDWLEQIVRADRALRDPFAHVGTQLGREDADATRPRAPTKKPRRH